MNWIQQFQPGKVRHTVVYIGSAFLSFTSSLKVFCRSETSSPVSTSSTFPSLVLNNKSIFYSKLVFADWWNGSNEFVTRFHRLFYLLTPSQLLRDWKWPFEIQDGVVNETTVFLVLAVSFLSCFRPEIGLQSSARGEPLKAGPLKHLWRMSCLTA